MSHLHEANEPKPWERLGLPVTMALIGKAADVTLAMMFGRGPDFGVVACDKCGRWQDFPGFTMDRFEEMRTASLTAGWKRIGAEDICPICARN